MQKVAADFARENTVDVDLTFTIQIQAIFNAWK